MLQSTLAGAARVAGFGLALALAVHFSGVRIDELDFSRRVDRLMRELQRYL